MEIAVGDMVWMNRAHLPQQVPVMLANRWFGPDKVISGHGVAVRLNSIQGMVSNLVNMRRLKFFEFKDSVFGAGELSVSSGAS